MEVPIWLWKIIRFRLILLWVSVNLSSHHVLQTDSHSLNPSISFPVLVVTQTLERRDAQEGFSKGEFRGASGYKPRDPNVLKLEPEDLNAACLNEIEDVNTMEGAILQMQSNTNNQGNPWRSKTGTTELDIEM